MENIIQDQLQALKAVQAKQTETMQRLVEKISQQAAHIEALNNFAQAVAQSHQDMPTLVARLHAHLEAIPAVPQKSEVRGHLQAIQNTAVGTLRSSRSV